MKRAIFLFVTVVSVVLSSYFLFCNKFNNEHFIQQKSKLYDKEINVPLNEWKANLIGKWRFEEIYTTSRGVQQVSGEKYYDSNGNFKNLITFKHFICRSGDVPQMEARCLHIIAGGTYSGTWSLDTTIRKWTEKILVCDIVTGRVDKGFKDPNFCENYYKINNKIEFGIADDSVSRFSIEKFTKNKIITRGHFYHNDKEYLLTLTRIKE